MQGKLAQSVGVALRLGSMLTTRSSPVSSCRVLWGEGASLTLRTTHAGDDHRALVRVAVDQGRITHADPRCCAGAVGIAGAVALAAEGSSIDAKKFLGTLAAWAEPVDGPICSSMAALPYLTGKVTYGFADVGSRESGSRASESTRSARESSPRRCVLDACDNQLGKPGVALRVVVVVGLLGGGGTATCSPTHPTSIGKPRAERATGLVAARCVDASGQAGSERCRAGSQRWWPR